MKKILLAAIALAFAGNLFAQQGPSFNNRNSRPAATQAEQEAGTSTSSVTTPGRQQFHPSAAKVWARWDMTANTITASYNVSGIVHDTTGRTTVSFSVPFSSTAYTCLAGGPGTTTSKTVSGFPAVGSIAVFTYTFAGVATDTTDVTLVCFGDQ